MNDAAKRGSSILIWTHRIRSRILGMDEQEKTRVSHYSPPASFLLSLFLVLCIDPLFSLSHSYYCFLLRPDSRKVEEECLVLMWPHARTHARQHLHLRSNLLVHLHTV